MLVPLLYKTIGIEIITHFQLHVTHKQQHSPSSEPPKISNKVCIFHIWVNLPVSTAAGSVSHTLIDVVASEVTSAKNGSSVQPRLLAHATASSTSLQRRKSYIMTIIYGEREYHYIWPVLQTVHINLGGAFIGCIY